MVKYAFHKSKNVGSNPTRFNVIRYNFLLVIFCLYSVKDVFIFNKFQKLVILLFNFVCINVKKFVSC